MFVCVLETKVAADPTETPEAVWIWTLSRLPKEYKENTLFLKALTLAEKIAKSDKGQKGFALVNKKGQAFDKAEVDKTKQHPEIEIGDPKEGEATYFASGWYDKYKKKDAIFFNKRILDIVLNAAKNNKEKEIDAVLFIAITILHETAHWKNHIMNGDKTRGEVGHKVMDKIFDEKPIRDFDVDEKGCLVRGPKPLKGTNKVSDTLKKKWINPDHWKASKK